MRILTVFLTAALTLPSAVLAASDALQMDKVKMGILPSGGLYSIYNVTCDDQSTSHVVREQQGRWCAGYDSQLQCFRKARQASAAACTSLNVAISEVKGKQHDTME